MKKLREFLVESKSFRAYQQEENRYDDRFERNGRYTPRNTQPAEDDGEYVPAKFDSEFAAYAYGEGRLMDIANNYDKLSTTVMFVANNEVVDELLSTVLVKRALKSVEAKGRRLLACPMCLKPSDAAAVNIDSIVQVACDTNDDEIDEFIIDGSQKANTTKILNPTFILDVLDFVNKEYQPQELNVIFVDGYTNKVEVEKLQKQIYKFYKNVNSVFYYAE